MVRIRAPRRRHRRNESCAAEADSVLPADPGAPSTRTVIITLTVGWEPDGRRDRITVRGRTRTEVKDKLRVKHQELAAGVRAATNYTIEQCLKDGLETLNTQAEAP
jgi:hypothetical protein